LHDSSNNASGIAPGGGKTQLEILILVIFCSLVQNEGKKKRQRVALCRA
jgi:hypothetical protein